MGEARNFLHKMEMDNKKCIIFFGSQTGTAEGYSRRLAKEGKSRFGLETMVASLEDYSFSCLDTMPTDKVAFFILATYGEGEPTDDAADFYELITTTDPSFSTGSSLPNLNYVAFGLGNKTYEHYNAAVRGVTRALDGLGATRIGEAGEADDGAGTTEESFMTWKETMWTALASRIGLQEVENCYEPNFCVTECEEPPLQSPRVYLGEPNDLHLISGPKGPRGPFDVHNPYVAVIVTSRSLLAPTVKDRNCIHMDIDISGTGISYETGDHVAVWPANAKEEVDHLLDVLGLNGNRHQVINIQSLDPGVKVPFPTPTTYDAMLRYYLEICAPISRQLVSDIVPFAPNETSKQKLATISKDKHLFHSETHLSNIARLLRELGDGQKWPRIQLSLLIEGLPKLQHRFYSISSSALLQPHTASITVAVKSEVVAGRLASEPFCGVASNFLLALHSARAEEPPSQPSTLSQYTYDVAGPRKCYAGQRVPIHIRHSSFRLPSDPLRPVIMVGPGTGVAPFRGFVQERAEMARGGESVGAMMLFFGCRRGDEDFMYEEWKVSFTHIQDPTEGDRGPETLMDNALAMPGGTK